MRNTLIADALILMILLGKHFVIPTVHVPIDEIPAGREIFTLGASMMFLFFALAQVNLNGYATILDTINVHRLEGTGVDPDYITAADKFVEFPAKLFGARLKDPVLPGTSYKLFSRFLMSLILTAIAFILLLHFSVVFLSGRDTLMQRHDQLLLIYRYLAFLAASNLGGLLVLTTLYTKFKFSIAEQRAPSVQPK